jgi:putative glutamine amidotransferase
VSESPQPGLSPERIVPLNGAVGPAPSHVRDRLVEHEGTFIGITAGHIEANGRILDATQREYGDRISDAGGIPLELQARPCSPVLALLSRVDGLLLTGGGDVAPALYGAEPAPETAGCDDERDHAEVALVQAAMAARIPILAVCRGIQILNVACGGTLVQHLPAVTAQPHLVIDRPREVVHSVELQPGSDLRRIVGVDSLGVNSLHHQAVNRIGTGLRPVAWAGDGTVEALEDQAGWVIGVQWHPELLADQSEQIRLFEWLVEQSSDRDRRSARDSAH